MRDIWSVIRRKKPADSEMTADEIEIPEAARPRHVNRVALGLVVTALDLVAFCTVGPMSPPFILSVPSVIAQFHRPSVFAGDFSWRGGQWQRTCSRIDRCLHCRVCSM